MIIPERLARQLIMNNNGSIEGAIGQASRMSLEDPDPSIQQALRILGNWSQVQRDAINEKT